MAILDFFKRKKEQERFFRKRETKKKEIAIKRAPLDTESKPDKKEDKEKIREKEGTSATGDAYRILSRPHFTEKSAILGERGVYVFKVKPEANKAMVKNTVSKLYGVTVEKVNISKVPSKKKFVRGKWGTKSGHKKAIVYLKKGERIEI